MIINLIMFKKQYKLLKHRQSNTFKFRKKFD